MGNKNKKLKSRTIISQLRLFKISPTLTCHSAGTADGVNSPATLFRADGFSSCYVLEKYIKD